jgi:hypothetical protein
MTQDSSLAAEVAEVAEAHPSISRPKRAAAVAAEGKAIQEAPEVLEAPAHRMVRPDRRAGPAAVAMAMVSAERAAGVVDWPAADHLAYRRYRLAARAAPQGLRSIRSAIPRRHS